MAFEAVIYFLSFGNVESFQQFGGAMKEITYNLLLFHSKPPKSGIKYSSYIFRNRSLLSTTISRLTCLTPSLSGLLRGKKIVLLRGLTFWIDYKWITCRCYNLWLADTQWQNNPSRILRVQKSIAIKTMELKIDSLHLVAQSNTFFSIWRQRSYDNIY